jgi:hypothetical protein
MSSASVPTRPRRPAARPVVDGDGAVYRSIVAAAKAQRVSISAIWQKATLQRGGWRFLDEPPETAPTPRPSQEG